MTTDRSAVIHVIQNAGPAEARQQFGDAIVTEVLMRGVGSPTADCACGGHTVPRPTYDHAAMSRTLAEANEVAAAVIASCAASTRRQQAAQDARRAELQRGIAVPHGRFFDHAAAARGLAASDRVHARQTRGRLATMNQAAADFWAAQPTRGVA